MTLEEALQRPAISVQDAGRLFFNLSRNAAYDAVRRGDIPSIRVGKKIVVPVVPVAAQLSLKTNIGGQPD